MIILAYLIFAFTTFDLLFFMEIPEWREPSRFFFGFFAVVFLAIDILLVVMIRSIYGDGGKK